MIEALSPQSLLSLTRHEAAIECAALVKLMTAMRLNHRVEWLYDGYAAERSLALLVSDYKGIGGDGTLGCEVVVNLMTAGFLR